jgi:hypothetical protein
MNFQKIEDGIKDHRMISFVVISVVFVTVLLGILGTLVWANDTHQPTEYPVIDIHFDTTKVAAEKIEEGTGMGHSLYRVFLNKRGTSQLLTMIQDNPSDIYLVNLQGTTPINDQWMRGDEFALELSGICGQQAAQDIADISDLKGFCESVILHFPSQKETTGWHFFSASPASCCDNYFRLRGFYTLAFFRDKQDNQNQYQAINIEPTPELGERMIKSLVEGKYQQIYTN